MLKKNKTQILKQKKEATPNHDGTSHRKHPSHEAHLKRLHRVQGQLDGIEGMILAQRYCPDIIAQLRAASSALKAIEAEIFKTHLRGCVKSAFMCKDPFETNKKIEEVMKMVF